MIIKTEKEILQPYFEDQSGLLGGHAHKVYIPETEQEIPDCLREMSANKTPVTVSGSGTGVTGGRIPFGGVVLSLERLDKILEIKQVSGNEAYAVVQAGVRISELKAAAERSGWLYPPDPTEQNSFIGGNIVTNASGSRGFKYGSTRDYIKRLKVVLSNGEILNIKRGEITASSTGAVSIPLSGKTLKFDLPKYSIPGIKNAAGYFNFPGAGLIDLFIGSEGTLGVIVEAEVKLMPAIKRVFSGVAFFPEKELAWQFAEEIRTISLKTRKENKYSDIDALSIEYLDTNALLLLKPDYPQIPDFAKACIMFEQDISNGGEDAISGKWTEILQKYKAPLDKIWLGASSKEQEMFRELRHKLPEKVNDIIRKNKLPKTYTDIAVPEDKLRILLEFVYKIAEKEKIDYMVFGHIGDCHLHANFLPKNKKEYDRCKEIYERLVVKVVELKGTVSAEHGIGKLKHLFLEKMVGSAGLAEMAKLKKALDPALILNLDNIFPKEMCKMENKKKAIFVIPNLGKGGAEKVFSNVLNGLDLELIEPICIFYDSKHVFSYPEKIKTYVLNLPAVPWFLKLFYFTARIIKIKKIIENEKPDVLFGFLTETNLVLLLAKLFSKNKPKLIISEHTVPSMHLKGRIDQKLLIKLLYNQAKGIVAVSNGVKKDLIDNFGIDETKISVIHNPVNLPEIAKLKTAEVRDDAFNSNIPVIINVGSLSLQKGHENLLKAFRLVKDKFNCKLVLIGEGPLKERLVNISEELRIKNDVYFLGFQNNPYKYIARSKVFVLSSLYEGFSNVLIEAMACGVPVVSFDCPYGPSEIIQNGVNGIIVKQKDHIKLSEAIIDIFNDSGLAAKLKENAGKYIERYDSKNSVKEYQKLI